MMYLSDIHNYYIYFTESKINNKKGNEDKDDWRKYE